MEEAGSPVRVLIVDDHALFAETLEVGLRYEGLGAVKVARQLGQAELIAEALSFAADVVLIDLDLGSHGSALPVITALAARGALIIVVTANSNRLALAEALEAGAISVFNKGHSITELVGVILGASVGAPTLRGREREELLAELAGQRAAAERYREMLLRLTRSERGVLARLMEGESAEEIAADRFVSVATVRTQIQAILRKLEVSSQLAVVALARQAGWSVGTGGPGPS